MAAYAALLSLTHTIDQIQNHPRPPISLHTKHLQSLTQNLTFLQDFLENYSINGGAIKDFERLEGRIAEASYEAEDVIESHVVDQIQAANAKSVNNNENKSNFFKFFGGLCKPTIREENIRPVDMYHQGLEKVMQDLDLIKKDAEEIVKQIGCQLERNYSMPAGGPRPHPSGPHGSMVGLDDVLLEAMDKLMGQHSARQILPIVGMGGIGKTILARNLYSHKTVEEHFYLRGWATISQQYDSKEILLEVLTCLKIIGSREMLSKKKEYEIGEILYKTLCGQKYLIVMDDVWSVRAWDKVKFFFPDNNNGSRIVITTRLSDLAFELSGSRGLEMGFLDEDNSWKLFRKSVFGEKDCPPELEEIGKKISKNCKGLPLSIVVTGGLLAMSVQTRKHWQYIAENLNSVVNLNDNERCLRILRLSYNHLPVHLKPCFIYMGIFPEDHLVSASTLVKLWVAEGFLKPIGDKTLEATAEEYLKDLVQRNLILIQDLGGHGDIKRFRIHDLLRDLCMKEAEKDRFFCVVATDKPNGTNQQIWQTQRRIGIQRREESTNKHVPRAIRNAVRSATLARSLICSADKLRRRPSQLLRVFHRIEVFIPEYTYSLKDIFRPVNSRHIVAAARLSRPDQFPSSFYHLWNLQTLIIDLEVRNVSSAPPVIDIWRMPRLRHVNIFTFHLPEPAADSTVLWDLQTLKTVSSSEWGEEAVRRIPNVKKLNLMLPYTKASSRDDYRLDNLCRLRVVESLCCNFYCRKEPFIRREHDLAMSLVFPHSIRKLTLVRASFLWDDLAAKVGNLPHLEVLKLKFRSCKGLKWETIQGQFCRLKVLEIHLWPEVEHWMMEDWDHFPCLERLVLDDFHNLKAIPLEIGEIPTLKWIRLINCNESLVASVKEMVEVQQEMGNEELTVSVALYEKNQLVESLAGPKFQVEVW
ncbi:disease resistance protein [Striga asiatica]|uniref:Disease resistance protein n=1 Tax=Striga asiatica TaxID=4170 RepID=A0A5A7QDK3_STRAF|nr:disease resistance protein [Striga asiatica]